MKMLLYIMFICMDIMVDLAPVNACDRLVNVDFIAYPVDVEYGFL
jgi:hypothetical protein